jgi:putative transposase
MPRRRASEIKLSEKERRILEQNSKGTHTPLHLKKRSAIILLSAAGKSNKAIKREMEIDNKTIRLWRNRYSGQKEELERTEGESPHKMRSKITEILSDEQRSGGPPKFTDEQVACIIALSLESPSNLELPFSHWSPRLLRIEAIKRGIVEEISERQVGRFLKR